MGRGLNKVMIIGHLGRDPELRYTSSGRPVTTFSMAINRTWVTGEGERRNETDWFTVVAWGSLADFTKKTLHKGRQVFVEGRLQTRRWDDENGIKHTSVEIIAATVLALGEQKPGTVDESDLGGDLEEDEYEEIIE